MLTAEEIAELLEQDGIYAALYKTQNALALEALK